jgi:hypothetical protein
MAERLGIDEVLKDMTDRLAQVRAGLEGLSGAIWQAIDHEDPTGLEAGVRFKQRYNEQRKELDACAGRMLALLREFPGTGPSGGREAAETHTAEPRAVPGQEEKSLPTSAIQAEAAPPVGNLEKKAPFGFILGGQTFTSASAWPLFYEALLQEFYARAPEKLSHLADAPGVFTHKGHALFARVPDRLEDPLPIAEALFAEADMDPEILLKVVRRLISELGYPLDSFKILLREKNRGTVETLSIAA